MQVMYGNIARATLILSSIPSLKRLKLRKLVALGVDDSTCSTLYAVPGVLPVGDDKISWFKVAVTALDAVEDSRERINDESMSPLGF